MSYSKSKATKEGIGINIALDKSNKYRWRTKEDIERIEEMEDNFKLYKGRHGKVDGGVFDHPYPDKTKEGENIPYIVLNILGKSSRQFSDLILSDDLFITCKNKEIQAFLDDQTWIETMWDALTTCSQLGYVGLQPYQENDKLWYEVIDGKDLKLIFEDNGKLKKIVKNIYFEYEDIQKICLLYQEIHLKGYYELHLYEVDGDYYKEELDISLLEKYKGIKVERNKHSFDLDDFLITILYNEKLGNYISSDYTLPAVRLQESLNNSETQINRVLRCNADPRLVVPRSAAIQDSQTGRYHYSIQGREVIFYDDVKGNVFSYLTWDGQLTSAQTHRDHAIMALCTELDMAPQLLGFHNLIGSTTSETNAKLKQLMNATIKRAKRKRQFLDQALKSLISKMLYLLGFNQEEIHNFSITYSEIIPRTREEILDEIIIRKQNKLEDSISAIIKLDNITEEEAKEKYNKIIEESTNEIPNQFSYEKDWDTKEKGKEEEENNAK